MLFSELHGRKVVSTSTARTVGRVDDFRIDVGLRSVVALHLKKTEGGDTLAWSDITAIGADAVTVPDASAIVEKPREDTEITVAYRQAKGRRVLATSGDQIGTVRDVDFDPATGALTTLYVDDRQVPGSALLGIGSYAVVVGLD